MSLATVCHALLVCTLINYALVILWFLLIAFPHRWLYKLWGRWFHLSDERFDALNFVGIAIYKVLILVFNLVPYLALRIFG